MKDIKSKMIDSMNDHNRGIKYLVTWFLSDTNNENNNLPIIPLHIANLCGSFYDQFYAITINIKYNNLHTHMYDVQFIPPSDHDSMFAITESILSEFIIFELVDPEIIHQKYFPLENVLNMKYKTFYLCHMKMCHTQSESNKDDELMQRLAIRIPINVFINANVLKQMILDIINPYFIKQYKTTIFDIYLPSISLDELYQVYIPGGTKFSRNNKNYDTPLCLIPNENQKQTFVNALQQKRLNLEQTKCMVTDRIIIRWKSLETFHEFFNVELFSNPLDTISNVCGADIYENDDEEAVTIENMFDQNSETSVSSLDENIFDQQSSSRMSMKYIDTNDEYDNSIIGNGIKNEIYSFGVKDMKLIFMESKVNDLNDKIGNLLEVIKTLKDVNEYLEKSKLQLINNTTNVINECRDSIKNLSKQNQNLRHKVKN